MSRPHDDPRAPSPAIPDARRVGGARGPSGEALAADAHARDVSTGDRATSSASNRGLPAPTRRNLLVAGAWFAAAAGGLGCTGTRAPRDGASKAAAELERRAELDALFAHLADDGPRLEPISPAERAERRARAGRLLVEAGADALFVEPGPTMNYLSGVTWGRSERLFALVVLADGSHVWIAPAFEESRARARIDAALRPEAPDDSKSRAAAPIVTWDEHEYAWPAIERAFAERGVGRVLLEPQVRHVFADRLSARLGAQRVASGAALVARLRGCKDAHELALLRRANECTQRAIMAVNETLRPGLTSRDVSARMEAAHAAFGMRGSWCLALIGPAAALPHGDSVERTLARGDVLLVDTGAAYLDYQSDITRTWVFGGAPSAEVSAIWRHVRDAQEAALAVIRPGVLARDVDRAARDLVTARGFGPGYRAFTHRLGHGIGLEGHEDPYFDGGSDVVLEPGMTLSNEPGIYLPGRFGVRIEDIVAVTADGVESFGRPQRGVESPA